MKVRDKKANMNLFNIFGRKKSLANFSTNTHKGNTFDDELQTVPGIFKQMPCKQLICEILAHLSFPIERKI